MIKCLILYIYLLIVLNRRLLMASLSTEVKTTEVKSKFTDEFEKYLKKQCLKTTFNGLEMETFSWYKKMLGLT